MMSTTADPQAEPETLLRPARAAELLGVRPRTIGKWAREGRLEGVRVGNRLRVTASSVARYVEANKIGKAEPDVADQFRDEDVPD